MPLKAVIVIHGADRLLSAISKSPDANQESEQQYHLKYAKELGSLVDALGKLNDDANDGVGASLLRDEDKSNKSDYLLLIVEKDQEKLNELERLLKESLNVARANTDAVTHPKTGATLNPGIPANVEFHRLTPDQQVDSYNGAIRVLEDKNIPHVEELQNRNIIFVLDSAQNELKRLLDSKKFTTVVASDEKKDLFLNLNAELFVSSKSPTSLQDEYQRSLLQYRINALTMAAIGTTTYDATKVNDGEYNGGYLQHLKEKTPGIRSPIKLSVNTSLFGNIPILRDTNTSQGMTGRLNVEKFLEKIHSGKITTHRELDTALAEFIKQKPWYIPGGSGVSPNSWARYALAAEEGVPFELYEAYSDNDFSVIKNNALNRLQSGKIVEASGESSSSVPGAEKDIDLRAASGIGLSGLGGR